MLNTHKVNACFKVKIYKNKSLKKFQIKQDGGVVGWGVGPQSLGPPLEVTLNAR